MRTASTFPSMWGATRDCVNLESLWLRIAPGGGGDEGGRTRLHRGEPPSHPRVAVEDAERLRRCSIARGEGPYAPADHPAHHHQGETGWSRPAGAHLGRECVREIL